MTAAAHHWIEVAVQTPAHSGVGDLLTYRSPVALKPGTLVRVPLGRRDVLGVVWQADVPAPSSPPRPSGTSTWLWRACHPWMQAGAN